MAKLHTLSLRHFSGSMLLTLNAAQYIQSLVKNVGWHFAFLLASFASLAHAEGPPKPPLPLPIFRDPFAGLSDAEVEARVPHFRTERAPTVLSRELVPQVAVQSPAPGADVEIVLPKNRCAPGIMTWGSQEEGFTSCRVLGRGQTVFASLRTLAGLRATQRAYRSWSIGQTSISHRAEWVKYKEHFGTERDYDYCMFKPDIETNGATIRERPVSTIGHYTLDTGRDIHRGKEYWGTRIGSSQLLMPVRMTAIYSPENEAYRNQGDLLKRDDFWIHSHENIRDEIPLETSSTFGCPRLSRACEQEFQEWVAVQNARSKLPVLRIVEEQ